MTEVLTLTRWEWFKLQRRWLPWILLVILLIFSQLSVWGNRDRLILPGSIYLVLGNIHAFSLLLLAILTASVTGIEYGLGTLRPALARGAGRWQYLAGKFLLLVLIIGATLLFVVLATAISSIVYQIIGGGASSSPNAPGWWDATAEFGRAWFSLMPYLALVTLATLLTRSTAAGNAIGLGYYFAEQIVSLILSALFDWFQNVADYLLVRSITDFTSGLSFNFGASEDTGLLRPALVLLVYTVALSGVAFWLFNRRDIAGASGS
ncbi:MAG: ABC transporter permease subunit [Dehalococcoidia bacterium]